MQLGFILQLVQLLALALAYSISEGSVSVNSDVIHFGEFETKEIKFVEVASPKDKITIDLTLSEKVKSAPHQVVITLGNGKGLDISYVPTFEDNKITLTIPAIKIPEVLKSKDKLLLYLIIGDDSSSPNLFKLLGEVILSSEFRATSKYHDDSTVGLQPEIHHQFRQDADTVNPLIPALFSWVGIVLLISLFAAWMIFVRIDLFGNFKSYTKVETLYVSGFLATLVGFETLVVRYYLFESIFTTIFHAAILAIPSVYFGSRVLRGLASLRLIGKA